MFRCVTCFYLWKRKRVTCFYLWSICLRDNILKYERKKANVPKSERKLICLASCTFKWLGWEYSTFKSIKNHLSTLLECIYAFKNIWFFLFFLYLLVLWFISNSKTSFNKLVWFLCGWFNLILPPLPPPPPTPYPQKSKGSCAWNSYKLYTNLIVF